MMGNEEFLLVKIENTKPIDLIEFTNSFIAIYNQYKRFIKLNYKTDEDIRLQIEELGEGSKWVKIIRYPIDKLIVDPLLQKFNEHLEQKFDAFLEQKIPYLENKLGHKLKAQEYKEIQTILRHNSHDYNSGIKFSSGSNNEVTHHHYYSGIQARAITDEAETCYQCHLQHITSETAFE